MLQYLYYEFTVSIVAIVSDDETVLFRYFYGKIYFFD